MSVTLLIAIFLAGGAFAAIVGTALRRRRDPKPIRLPGELYPQTHPPGSGPTSRSMP